MRDVESLLMSVMLPVIWDTTFVASTLFFFLGIFVAVRFAVLRDQKSDEASYLHYNVSFECSLTKVYGVLILFVRRSGCSLHVFCPRFAKSGTWHERMLSGPTQIFRVLY